MLFLIEYNRKKGEIQSFKAFADADRKVAEDARLDLELHLNRTGVQHEVVILEAADEAAIRRTHRRYFEDLASLARVPADNGNGAKP